MKWAAVLGITFIFVCMALFEWPKLGRGSKKEKIIFLSLSVIGWFLGSILVFFPNPPGPTELMDGIFKPLGKLLEK